MLGSYRQGAAYMRLLMDQISLPYAAAMRESTTGIHWADPTWTGLGAKCGALELSKESYTSQVVT